MLKALANYTMSIPPVFTDGLTYILIAFFGAWAATFSTDDATKYISPQVLFWLRATCASLGASLLALKMFRSTSFADHQQSKRDAADASAALILNTNPHLTTKQDEKV